MSKSLIKLKNVSKFYYSKGVIASGFTRINLDFKMGEFVAITGESGSGKSTLLNVISGLDSYEEGEMYINGEETSHFTENDFEDYRRKYIGNIFQNFNLVNSYTVYQNIELVLLLNGSKKREIKNDIHELIKKVGLWKFRNTKVSKLSGGQKQRVAIARALAKDTPIIIADEPTGNLDSKSANEIIKLLADISKNKLVIIVTHNYEQVEDYVTRKIKMHDGKVLEDKRIKEINDNIETESNNYKNITFLNQNRLGIRNAFNIFSKFALTFLVYLFLATAVISVYSNLNAEKYSNSMQGYNNIFNRNTKRIIVKNDDNSAFTEEEYTDISAIKNVKSIVKNDMLLDMNVDLNDNDYYWFYGKLYNIDQLDKKLTVGRMPEKDNEIVIKGYDYEIIYEPEKLLGKELSFSYNYEVANKMKVVIVGVINDEDNDFETYFYAKDSVIEEYAKEMNKTLSEVIIKFRGSDYNSVVGRQYMGLEANKNVKPGEVIISSSMQFDCPEYNCINQKLGIKVHNLYFDDSKVLKVTKIYDKDNYKKLLGIKNELEEFDGTIFVNPQDLDKLFTKGNYQISVFVNDDKNVEDVVKVLNDKGYVTLDLKTALIDSGDKQIMQIIETIVMLTVIFVVFFICYFVIKVIMKSKNVYFATIRMLGANKKISKHLLTIELLTISNAAYICVLVLAYLQKIKFINVDFLKKVIDYFKIQDYILLYIIIICMSFVIAQRYARKLFGQSVIKSIKEEV